MAKNNSTRGRRDRRRAATLDSTGDEVRLLDVGPNQYGDCILCRLGGKTILIDGAHPGDDSSSAFVNIKKQLTALIGAPPFKVDLLVVTHTHIDHTGCLPTMVLKGDL